MRAETIDCQVGRCGNEERRTSSDDENDGGREDRADELSRDVDDDVDHGNPSRREQADRYCRISGNSKSRISGLSNSSRRTSVTPESIFAAGVCPASFSPIARVLSLPIGNGFCTTSEF